MANLREKSLVAYLFGGTFMPIIHSVLAKHSSFANEELDFIIKYDIKWLD